MYEPVKKIKRLTPKEKLIIKTKEGLTLNEKKQSEIIAKYILYKRYTNAERFTNTGVNTAHIIRNKKSSMDSKKIIKSKE